MTHAELVRSLCKPAEAFAQEITPRKAHLIHMVMGISGEAGELLDAIKKNVVYDQLLDVNNVKEELGDLEFYMEGLRQALSISRADVLEQNVAKLQKRYGEKYSNQGAQERKDKHA